MESENLLLVIFCHPNQLKRKKEKRCKHEINKQRTQQHNGTVARTHVWNGCVYVKPTYQNTTELDIFMKHRRGL